MTTAFRSQPLTRRTLLRAGGAGALAWAVGYAAAGQPSAEPIIVGHQAPLSGSVAQFGRWHNRALEAAVERVNVQGGIAGRPIELITEDSGSNPDDGIDAFRRLILQRDCQFVIGSVWSGTNIATAPLAAELKIPYFPQGIATDITGAAGNRYVFKSYHTVRAAVRAGASWAVENLGRRWTIVASELAFAQSQAADWQGELSALGAEVVDVISVPFRPSDFVPFVSRIDLAQTDAVYQAFTAVDTARFLSTARDLGFTDRLNVFGLIEGIDVLDTSGPEYENTAYVTSYPRLASEIPSRLSPYDAPYRAAIGIADDGFSETGEVAPIADLFGSWQALSLIREGVEASRWIGPSDTLAFIAALEGTAWEAGPDYPQGAGTLRATDHLAFHDHYVERVADGQLRVQARIPRENSLYDPPADLD